MSIPSGYALVLLSLAVFRLWRLIAADEITTTLRAKLVGISDEEHAQWAWALNALQHLDRDPWDYFSADDFLSDVSMTQGDENLPPLVSARLMGSGENWDSLRPDHFQVVPFSKRRWYWSKLLHCPWCLGWWLSVAVWLAWQAEPHATLVFAVPFAVSAVVGLVAHYSAD